MKTTSHRVKAYVLAILFLIAGAAVNAQTNVADLKKQKEEAEAQRDAYKALLEAETAKRAYEMATDPTKQASDSQAAATKTAKDEAEAQTALANARKAQSEAELAAIKKRFGDFNGSGIDGKAELGEKAGSAEATLLGSAAINHIADVFAASIISAKPVDPKKAAEKENIILATPTTIPNFQALTAFELQFNATKTAVAVAEAKTGGVKTEGVKTESLASIGLGAEAISKLLSFAKTDYTFKNIDISSSDAMLVYALAGKLDAANVVVPSIYAADAISQTNTLLGRSMEINQWLIDSKRRLKTHEAAVVEAEKKLTDNPKDEAAKKLRDENKSASGIWKSVSESVEAWSKQLSTADDKGNSPIATIAREFAIKQKLDEKGTILVIVELHKLTGTGYTKKNLWSSLGANPFFVMGGAVASYVALDGPSGRVLSAKTLPVHGGYHSVSQIQAVVNSGTSTTSQGSRHGQPTQ